MGWAARARVSQKVLRSPAGFGEPFDYYPKGAGGRFYNIHATWTEPTEELDLGMAVGVNSRLPTAGFFEGDFISRGLDLPDAGDELVRKSNSRRYSVESIREDGEGMRELHLVRA